MHFTLDIKPLSVNQAWQGKRFKTTKYKEYQKECLLLMPNKKLNLSNMIRVDLIFGFSSKLSDIDNPVKMVLDICQKKYGFNDRDVFEINIQKKLVQKGSEFIEISIENYLPFN